MNVGKTSFGNGRAIAIYDPFDYNRDAAGICRPDAAPFLERDPLAVRLIACAAALAVAAAAQSPEQIERQLATQAESRPSDVAAWKAAGPGRGEAGRRELHIGQRGWEGKQKS